MTKHILDDNLIVRMYNNGDLVSDISTYFGVDGRTIYRHLRTQGIEPNRKVSPLWTEKEELQLIDAHRNGVTGRAYEDWVPTRTKDACKGHIRKLGM